MGQAIIMHLAQAPPRCMRHSRIPNTHPRDSDPGSLQSVPNPGTPNSTGECSDQRAMKFDQPVTFKIDPGVTGIDELANMAYEEKSDGDDSSGAT